MRRKLAILAIACLFISPVAALQFEAGDSGYGSGIIDPTLTLVSPNGGESWAATTLQYVNWTSVGSLGEVKLEYSKDGFSSDVNTIISSTANDGSYQWNVVNDPSSTVKVRVSFVDDASINDSSNASFTLTAPSGITHWWKLDESTGTTASDSQGSADGTLYNMDGSDWVTGVLNNGLDFDGSDDYVSVADQASLDVTDALTLAAWVKPRNGGSAGDIGDSVIDSYEFDTSYGDDPYIIQLAGDIYAIAYSGSSNDGWLKTVEIDSSGNIENSIIDSLEFDTSYGKGPHLIPIDGDIYAIAYTGTDNDGWLKTVDIDASGNIENSVIDSLEFDTSNGYDPHMIPIDGDVYAIAYSGTSSDGWLKTVEIDSNGNIENSVVDSLEFDTSKGTDPYIIPIDGDIYAIAYGGNSDDGWLKTVDIDASGNIENSVIDSLEFDTSNGEEPHIISIAGDIYAIAYRGKSDDGWLKTVEIDSSGNIENAVIDSLEYDTSYGEDPRLISIDGDIYAIAYEGYSDDGWLKTVDIDASGNIENAVIDSLEYDTSNGEDPSIISIDGDIYAIAYKGSSDDGWLKTIQISSGNGTLALKSGAYGLNATGSKVYATINARTISADVSANVWQHVTMTYDKDAGGTQELKLFVNGTLQASADYSTTISTNGHALLIGDDFDGTLDEVRFYNSALTTSQVADLYSGYFSLTLTAPDGGESWAANTQQSITWNSTGPISNVKLEYSKDNFASDVNTIVASTTNDGSYSWTVVNDPSTTVRVRVSDASNSSLYDVSDGDLTITYTTPSPVAWWRLDESSGITADDAVGTNDGTLYNSPSWSSSGVLNNSLNFPQSNDYVLMADDDLLDIGSDSYSFTVWARSSDSGTQTLFAKGSVSGDAYALAFSNNYAVWAIYDGGTLYAITATGADYTDGDWHHLTGVVDRTNDELLLYIDGASAATAVDISSAGSVTSTGHLELGALYYGSQDLQGDLDEFRIYRAALTASEITTLYNSYTKQLTLTAPNGNENWTVATPQTLTWTAAGPLDNVKLEYSKDNFASDVNTIATSTANDGSYTWTVPSDPSTTVRVRVSDVDNSSVNDISDADFIIYDPPASGSDLRHWWRFDETSGDTASDSEGDTDGTLLDDAGWDAAGKLNHTLELDGADDVVRVDDDDTLDVDGDDSVSFALWFKVEDDDEDQYLFYKGSGTPVYRLRVEHDGDLEFYLKDTGGDSDFSQAEATDYDDGGWYHTVAVINRTSDMMYLYVDGELEDSTSISSIGSLANSGDLFIGAKNDDGDNDLDGFIDEFRFYDVALSASEVSSLYASYTSAADLRHWWKFDETSGDTASDSEGDTDGDLNNGATWNSNGKLNGALELDGGNDVVVVDDDSTLDVGASDSVSFALWFKADDDDETQYLFYKRNGDARYYLKLQSDGKLKFYIKDTQNDGESTRTSSTTYDDGNWYHVVGVIDRSNDMMYIYVDGDLKDSDSISDVDDLSNSGDLYIGAKSSSGSSEFGGLIDEFRFYDEALDSDAVQTLYDSY